MARNFYFGKFWFETSRFAYGFKPNILLEAIRTRTPPYSNGVVYRTLFHAKERGWVETRPSLRLELKSRLRDEVQAAGSSPAREMKSSLRDEVQAAG